MKCIKALFSEHGDISMMRVMSIICCLAAVIVAFAGLNKPVVDYSGVSLLVTTFLTAAMGGKIMQKRIEVSGAKSDISIDQSEHRP
jgi:FtsH-binding integral membrane protein